MLDLSYECRLVLILEKQLNIKKCQHGKAENNIFPREYALEKNKQTNPKNKKRKK